MSYSTGALRPATRDDLLGLPLEVAPRLLGGILTTVIDGESVAVRLTEVEVHHADLGCDYTAAHFSPTLTAHLLDRRRKELDRDGVALRVSPSDAEPWSTRDDGPQVSGSTAELLWWLLGRGGGSGGTCSEGQVPDLGKWA